MYTKYLPRKHSLMFVGICLVQYISIQTLHKYHVFVQSTVQLYVRTSTFMGLHIIQYLHVRYHIHRYQVLYTGSFTYHTVHVHMFVPHIHRYQSLYTGFTDHTVYVCRYPIHRYQVQVYIQPYTE